MFQNSFTFLLCCFCIASGDCKITCDVETYVLSGIEFARCHQGTMEAFPATPLNMNPCPALTHLVNTCSEVLKPCYDERGWIRGRQAFLELLSLQYPDQNECDVFDKSNNNNSEHPQQLPDEKCSINDEVVLMQDMRTCSSEAQSEVLKNLISIPPTTPSQSHMENTFSEIICAGLQNVSEKCYVTKLTDCYDEQEAQFHLAFLLEELRLTGITLVSHLLSSQTNSSSDDLMDVDNCYVFKHGPLSMFISHQTSIEKTSDSKSVVVLAVLLSLLVAFVLVVAAYFVVFKSRLGPILRARFENTPYTDFVAQESGAQTDPQPAPVAENRKSGSQAMSMVVTNESVAAQEGPST